MKPNKVGIPPLKCLCLCAFGSPMIYCRILTRSHIKNLISNWGLYAGSYMTHRE